MKPVLVTTQYRGVFFGYLEGEPKRGHLTLSKARNCLYWEEAIHGVFGLASDGPTSGCRIGPRVAEITLYGITSVTPVEPDAVEKWESVEWK